MAVQHPFLAGCYDMRVRKAFFSVAFLSFIVCCCAFYRVWLWSSATRAELAPRSGNSTIDNIATLYDHEQPPNASVHVHVEEAFSCSSLQDLPAWNARPEDDPKPLTVLQPVIEKNCSLLRAGNSKEVWRVKRLLRKWSDSEAQKQFSSWMSGDCPSVARQFSDNFYVSQEEVDFPIAFVLLVHTNPLQVVRLLRAIYRPHNLYCIHPDAKQSAHFISVFRKLAACLPNVIVASELQEVYWGYHTMMDGELTCMQDLLQFEGHRWKYVINIGGQELPLKTNREMVGVLRAMEGASAVYGIPISQKLYNDRFVSAVALSTFPRKEVVKTWKRLPPVPHGIQLYKGTHFCSLTREFTEFILTDQKAVDFREYLKQVFIPEEEFYPSLYMLPGAPVKRLPYYKLPHVDLYFWESHLKYCRGGNVVRGVCILGVLELENIHLVGVGATRPVLFMNKYHSERDHVVMDCMEEWLLRRNAMEHKQDLCSYFSDSSANST